MRVRRLVVSRGAIVTPAVRDELLRRGIALAYGDAANGHPATTVRFVLVTVGTDFDPDGVGGRIGARGVKRGALRRWTA